LEQLPLVQSDRTQSSLCEHRRRPLPQELQSGITKAAMISSRTKTKFFMLETTDQRRTLDGKFLMISEKSSGLVYIREMVFPFTCLSKCQKCPLAGKENSLSNREES